MKKSVVLILFIVAIHYAFSQITTGKITGIKDSWGESITYVGEMKNNQPNGLGIATYNNGHALKYAGNFVNGLYSGKGTMLFNDGAFLTGDWKNGRLNGKGANLTASGNLYVGLFFDGKKEGKGNLLYSDNSILQGEWKTDQFNSRCIYIPGTVNTISDNIYTEDKKNGQGYQYELENKKLFQGRWKDGTWDGATTDNYSSFLTAADFYAEKTDKQILIGSLDKTSHLLYDTGFFYDLTNKRRFFGTYENGRFQKGVIVLDDSSRFVGAINEEGSTGYASYYKVGHFYDEGNYLSDYLNGPGCLSIDLKTKTIYFGDMTDKGVFTGKAWFATAKNELYNGEYKKGQFTGNGYLINADGYCTKGTWNNGYPVTVTSLTDDKGIPIPFAPKTLAEAVTIVAKQAKTELALITGAPDDDLDLLPKYKSIIAFPAGLKKDYIEEDDDFNLNYTALYLTTTDFAKAKIKYKELCKQLAALKITLDKTEAAFSLEGSPADPDATKTTNACIFTFPDKKGASYNYAASVVMTKDETGKYTVEIILGDRGSPLLTGAN